jgi:rubredoxin
VAAGITIAYQDGVHHAVAATIGGREKTMSDFKKYECVICGLIYDEAEGWPDDGIAPGTKWEDVPEDWECPDCGISKYDFDLMEG